MPCELASARGDRLELLDVPLDSFGVALGKPLVSLLRNLLFTCQRVVSIYT